VRAPTADIKVGPPHVAPDRSTVVNVLKSAVNTPRRAVLIDLARRRQVTERRAAVGRCLTASLDLALAAHRLGVAVTLVRWKVRRDADFVDHWAVRLDTGHVIDLTRVQVDRSTRLVSAVDDYPADYVDCRDYPASLFLANYVRTDSSVRDTLPARFMLGMARTMFCFDVATALRAFFPVRVLTLASELCTAHLRVARAAAVKRLEARRDGLWRRLS
jgi:hypothetical protein